MEVAIFKIIMYLYDFHRKETLLPKTKQ